jgi:Tfp pilus assembly protein PilN
MIKINLLPLRKAKRAEKGQEVLAVGLGTFVALGAVVYLVVHKPLQDEIDRGNAEHRKIQASIASLKERTKDFEKLEAAFKQAEGQQGAIDRLQNSRAVPAWFLHELSMVLTSDKQPTMTPDMARRVLEDPNRAWTPGWDPKHVWVESFEETGGQFLLRGGAQSDSDMTQLAFRLQASMYFEDVLPQGGDEVNDPRSGISYYSFTLTGRVVY